MSRSPRRVPIVATGIVALAIAAMIGLGLWQLLIRLPEKEAQLARLSANPALPPIPFPRQPDDRLLFRRAFAVCRPPVRIARAGAGNAGYRLIATCAADAAGPAFDVQLGTTRDPDSRIEQAANRWRGGPVRGWISHTPDATPMIERLLRPRPARLLLVSDRPAAGLAANTRPDVSLVPNNHLAYAGQWFLFAGVAAVIYMLALRRRGAAGDRE